MSLNSTLKNAVLKRRIRSRRKSRKPIISTFTDDQAEAYSDLSGDLFGAPGGMYKALGYAGTGKTYFTGGLAEQAIIRDYEVICAAPTHQAKVMMHEHLPKSVRSHATSQTIHSLLKLAMRPDKKTGEHILVQQGEPRLPDGKCIIFVDEASMIGSYIGGFIEEAAKQFKDATWVFIGDPAQLPPVKDTKWKYQDFKGPVLTEIVRQSSGNPIIQAATAIREGRDWRQHATNDGDVGIWKTRDPGILLEQAARKFQKKAYEDNPYLARVLASTNAAVNEWNRKLKNRLYPDADEWTAGMWAITGESYYEGPSNDIGALPVVTTSEMVQIKKAKKKIAPTYNEWLPTWKIEAVNQEGETVRFPVLAEEGKADYEEALQHRLDTAKMDSNRSNWKDFYNLKEAFCDLRPPFASTVHKAQGSTYESVFLDESTLRRFPGNRRFIRSLYYVSFTRASKRMIVLI